jgi:hypothetical protein
MPLDYKNLPLLLTVEDVAEMFRCSPATIRKKRKGNPDWLKPSRHALMRMQLFATVDVLALLGHAAPVQSPAPLEGTDPWNPDAADEAIERAQRERMRDQMQNRSDREAATREAWAKRIASHPASARADRVVWRDTKVRLEVSADGEAFRFWLHFQPRFCPPGWPGKVSIPRTGPEWVKLETDAEMERLRADVDAVMADHEPQYAALVAEQARVRKRRRKAAG